MALLRRTDFPAKRPNGDGMPPSPTDLAVVAALLHGRSSKGVLITPLLKWRPLNHPTTK